MWKIVNYLVMVMMRMRLGQWEILRQSERQKPILLLCVRTKVNFDFLSCVQQKWIIFAIFIYCFWLNCFQTRSAFDWKGCPPIVFHYGKSWRGGSRNRRSLRREKVHWQVPLRPLMDIVLEKLPLGNETVNRWISAVWMCR